MSLADQDRGITLLTSVPDPGASADPALPTSKPSAAARRSAHVRTGRAGGKASTAARTADGAPADTPVIGDHFYRDLVWNLRNGVLAARPG